MVPDGADRRAGRSRRVLHLLIAYAYPLMVPLSLIEGPIVALAAGVGAASGRINPIYAFIIVMGGALFQDVVYYWLGRWAMQSGAVRRFAERTRLIRGTMESLKTAWREKMFLTLVASKFAYGLYAPIIVSAGAAKASYWPFLGESLLLSAFVLGGWLGLGLGVGRSYGLLGRHADWIMAGLGVLAVIGLFFIARYARRRLDPGGGTARSGAGRGS